MSIQGKNEIVSLLQNNSDKIQDFGVSRVGVFGSYARGEQNDGSDVDLLVDFNKDKKTYKNFIKLADYLEQLFGRKVDLLTPQSLSPYIAPHIEKEIQYVQIT